MANATFSRHLDLRIKWNLVVNIILNFCVTKNSHKNYSDQQLLVTVDINV